MGGEEGEGDVLTGKSPTLCLRFRSFGYIQTWFLSISSAGCGLRYTCLIRYGSAYFLA
jgi:hypothetical protein